MNGILFKPEMIKAIIEDRKTLTNGQTWEGSLERCPSCNHKGFVVVDGMGSATCPKCRARFIPTISGVMYVGQDEFNQFEPEPVQSEGGK